MLSGIHFKLISEKSQGEKQREMKYPVILFDMVMLIQVLRHLVSPFIETVSFSVPTSLLFVLLFIYCKTKGKEKAIVTGEDGVIIAEELLNFRKSSAFSS